MFRVASNNGIDLNSVGTLATLKNSLSSISEETTKAIAVSGKFTKAQAELILKAKGVETAEIETSLATGKFAATEGTATIATESFKNALKGLWATIKSNPLLWVAAALVGVYTAVDKYEKNIEEARQNA